MQWCLSLSLSQGWVTSKMINICAVLGAEARAMDFIEATLNCTVADDFLGANGFIYPSLD